MTKKIISLLCIFVVCFSFLAIDVSASEQYIYVKADVLNLRSDPSTDGDVLGHAVYGDSLIVFGKIGDWYNVYYWGVTGFVHSDYVSVYHPDKTPTYGEKICDYATKFIGIPYVYGGSTPSGFDCSGFVKYVYANFGINLPRVSYSQMNVGTPVTRDQLLPGDLVFFRSGGHVGIYMGNNKYIHAPQTGRTISIAAMNRELYCARRLY